MGKRKRNSGDNSAPPPTDDVACSSGTKSLLQEDSYKHDEEDNAVAFEYHNQHHGRSFFLKRSRHHYGHQYTRRIQGSNGSASSSPSDERTISRLLAHSVPGSSKGILRSPEIIQYNFLNIKVACPICQKRISSVNYEIAAVLSCGHVYHAECLESKTEKTRRHDPLCPLCARQI